MLFELVETKCQCIDFCHTGAEESMR